MQCRHPWIFSGAVAKVEGEVKSGETVAVISSDGLELGYGSYSPSSQIRVRMLTFRADERVTEAWVNDRVLKAADQRKTLGYVPGQASFRMIHGESDGLPGVVADCYGEFVVCQFLSAGAEYWKDTIVAALKGLLPGVSVYERSDAEARTHEGLDPRCGVLAGKEPPELIEIREGEHRFLVNLREGHKTGFYLDQRENRRMVSDMAAGRAVLNCFSYSGGFGIHAAKAGATHVLNLDSAESALSLAERNFQLNEIAATGFENLRGDVFQVLRKFRDTGKSFDLIILDPPKFAETKAMTQKAARGYKDINLLALKLLKAGGVLATFSCSGGISRELFHKIVADAALDAGRSAKIIRQFTQPPDHPISLSFPEGAYLKGLLCVVE